MKLCRGCGEAKPPEAFAKRTFKSGTVGLMNRCKACNKAYRQAHRVRITAVCQAWVDRNRERSAEIKRQHFLRNREACLARADAWNKAHPENTAAQNRRRREAIKNGTVVWANKFFIEEAYALAKERTAMLALGVDWTVDHIVPVRGRTVCGLHTHDNLQVVPRYENIRKADRLVAVV